MTCFFFLFSHTYPQIQRPLLYLFDSFLRDGKKENKRNKPNNPGFLMGPVGGGVLLPPSCFHAPQCEHPPPPQPSALLSPRARLRHPQSLTHLSPCGQRLCLLWGHTLVGGPREIVSAGPASVAFLIPPPHFSVSKDTCMCSVQPQR